MQFFGMGTIFEKLLQKYKCIHRSYFTYDYDIYPSASCPRMLELNIAKLINKIQQLNLIGPKQVLFVKISPNFVGSPLIHWNRYKIFSLNHLNQTVNFSSKYKKRKVSHNSLAWLPYDSLSPPYGWENNRHSDCGYTCITIGIEAKNPKTTAQPYRIMRISMAFWASTTAMMTWF